MSELESPVGGSETEVLLPELPAERDIEGDEVKASIDWEKAENEFGSVEFKLYKSEKSNGKVIIYLPGLGGPVDSFEGKYVKSLTDEGYDVATIRRNGTIIDIENRGAINSDERLVLATQQSQDHFGNLPEYGYKEWSQEMACAAVALEDQYQEIQVIGHSFGGLVGLESIRLLQEQNKRLQKSEDEGALGKISRFVSLSGQTGNIENDEGINWIDREKQYDEAMLLKIFAGVASGGGGCRMKEPEIVRDECLEIAHRLYDEETVLPKHIDFGTVSAEGDKYFSLQHSHDMWAKIKEDGGNVRVWHNRAETPKNAHKQTELTPKALLEMLQTPTEDQRLRVVRRNNPLGPDFTENN